jgi:dihydrofolate reductase
VVEEAAAALGAADKDVGIGGAGLAAAAIELGLVDELRMFRNPVVVGGGTPFLPPVTEDLRRWDASEPSEREGSVSLLACSRLGHARPPRLPVPARCRSGRHSRGGRSIP